MLDDDEGICQLMALEAIGEHGVRSVAALPKVERAMQSEDSQIHIAALKSAQRIKRALAKARQADS